MKTVKAKVCRYNCKTHKMEIVEEEMPVYPEPKPVPSPQEVHIKIIVETLTHLLNWANSVSEKLNIPPPAIDLIMLTGILNWYNEMYGLNPTDAIVKAQNTSTTNNK